MSRRKLTKLGAIGLALAATMSLAGVVAPASAADTTFGDAKLAACVAGSVRPAGLPGATTFTQAQLDTLVHLSCSGVATLDGLESAPNIERFYMNGGTFTSIAPLANATKLLTVQINSTTAPISDLSPLSRATGLTELTMYSAPTASLAALAGMTDLYDIELWDTNVSDLTPLAGLSSLNTLELLGSSVTNLAPLASLSSLEYLRLPESPLSDLTPLASLANLSTLDVNNTSVSSLSPLSGLSNLSSVSFDDTAVSDLAPLRGLSDLHEISGEGAAVLDVSGLPTETAPQDSWPFTFLMDQVATAGRVAPNVAVPNPLRGFVGQFLVPSAASLTATGATLSPDASTITFPRVGSHALEWETESDTMYAGQFSGTVTFTVATPIVTPPIIDPPVIEPPVIDPPLVPPVVVEPPVVGAPPAVVAPPTAVKPPATVTPAAAPVTPLASTGVELTVWPFAAALMLLVAGAGLLVRRKRA